MLDYVDVHEVSAAALEGLAVMREEVEAGRLPVVKIEAGQGRAAGEEKAPLPFEESEEQVSLERGQPIGRSRHGA
jgi:hypothetical protein